MKKLDVSAIYTRKIVVRNSSTGRDLHVAHQREWGKNTGQTNFSELSISFCIGIHVFNCI